MLNKFRAYSKVNYGEAVLNSNETEFEINNWVISTFVVKKLVPVVGIHPFPLNELMLMAGTICRFRPELIFEWGTNIGKSARVFYETIKAFKISCQIHSIDLPDNVHHNEHPQKNRGKLVKGLKHVTLHQADGLTQSFEIYKKSGAGKRVVFFIDGDHGFETVKKELGSILKQIPNAIILLHDTFYQSSGSGYNIGPYMAMKHVLQMDDENYNIVNTNTGLPGMTLIYKRLINRG